MTTTTPVPTSIASAGFGAELRAEFADNWNAAVEHRFVDELADDRLNPDVLRTYLVQDFSFVKAFIELLNRALQHAPTPAARDTYRRQIDLLLADENAFFYRSFAALDVPAAEYENPVQHEVTARLTTLMHEVRGYAESLTLLVVAEWVYLDWAESVVDDGPELAVGKEWVGLHSGPQYRAWTQFLVDEFDALAAAVNPELRETMRELWGAASELEYRFFDAAYEG